MSDEHSKPTEPEFHFSWITPKYAVSPSIQLTSIKNILKLHKTIKHSLYFSYNLAPGEN